MHISIDLASKSNKVTKRDNIKNWSRRGLGFWVVDPPFPRDAWTLTKGDQTDRRPDGRFAICKLLSFWEELKIQPPIFFLSVTQHQVPCSIFIPALSCIFLNMLFIDPSVDYITDRFIPTSRSHFSTFQKKPRPPFFNIFPALCIPQSISLLKSINVLRHISKYVEAPYIIESLNISSQIFFLLSWTSFHSWYINTLRAAKKKKRGDISS